MLLAVQNPTTKHVDAHGYESVSTSDEWKQACMVLPCFAALTWPNYDTKVLEDKIDGQDVVIQLWKGNCPQFLNRADFPGGIGGEVGVYRRVKGHNIPKVDFLPAEIRPFYEAAIRVGGDALWWPDPAIQPEISFTLINEEARSGQKMALLGALPVKSYWQNKWMSFASFDKYEKANGGPRWATGFKMQYSINGKTYPIW